jgi:predicted phosphodiesterase
MIMERDSAPGLAGATIGIMADSHGRPDVIARAIDCFTARRTAWIYHLGDVCDSTLPDTAAACVRPLRRTGITTLMGNNDRSMLVNAAQKRIDPEIQRFLEKLPLTASYRYALFAHSLPFEEELGPACLIGPMDDRAAGRFFEMWPDSVLFRGHSHNPEIAFRVGDRLLRRPIETGRRVHLAQKLPCIVTCGALTRALGLVWQPDARVVELIRFD